MSVADIVCQILKESANKDEKTLLENLYNILINSSGQFEPGIPKLDELYPKEQHAEFCKKLEHIISVAKASVPLVASDDSPSVPNAVHKVNISSFLNYELKSICDFVAWIFQRQYGWVDKCGMEEDISNNTATVDQTYEHGVKSMLANFIAWLENHDHLSYNLLLAYKHALKCMFSFPAVRKQVVHSFFCWLKNLSSKYVIVVWKCFLLLKDIIFLAITDVWSAIRRDTASKLSLAVDLFDEEMIKSLFLLFVETCESEESSWQAVEGASRGVDKILGCCKWVPASTILPENSHMSPSVCIKLGRDTFPSLPQFMKEKLETVLFKLFAHQQLSVREIAGKAFSSFLYKSEYSYFIESFEKVIGYIKQDLGDNPTLTFMNAYEAEGFLNAVLFLIKNIPLAHIIVTWIDYWSVFSHYLTHPASTVRQTTSLIFKYILSKHQTSVYFLKLVMQSLCCGWKTDVEKLTESDTIDSDTVTKHRRLSVSSRKNKHDLSCCWEWREGRLLAYEVIMKYLLTNHTFFSLSSHSEQLSSGLKRIMLNNSITEGQFLGGQKLKKQHSFLQQHTVNRKKLVKSLTLTQFQVPENVLNNDKKHTEKGRSLIDIAKEEVMEEESTPFLAKQLPHVELEKITDLSFTNVITDATNRQYENEEVNKWLKRQKYSTFQVILKQILLQTIESLEDQRWELRRMSQQLLSCICEVVRSYNYRLLEDLYVIAFNHPNSGLYYGGCFCLLNSLKNYIKMKKISTDVTPSKYCESKRVGAGKSIEQFERNMNKYFMTIAKTLCQCQHKDTCNITMQMLLLYHSYVSQKENLISETISSYFQKLYISKQESQTLTLDQIKVANKKATDLLCEAQSFLQDYCNKNDVGYTIQLLPVILQSIHLISTDALDIHVMMNCCETILTNLANTIYDDTLLSVCCMELCHIIEKEELEAYLQQACNITLLLRDVMKSTFDHAGIEATIKKRIKSTEKEMTGDLQRILQPPTPDYDRIHKGSISEDYLSYSTSSFESLRIVEEESASSSEEEENEREEEADDLSSDWDFSSADETEQDGSMTINILSNFLHQLNGTLVNL